MTSSPALQPYEDIRALLRARKNDEAIVKSCARAVMRPDDLDAKELLFDAFYHKRDWPPAYALADELVHAAERAAAAEVVDRHAVQHEALSRGDRARAGLPALHGEDLMILDALKIAHFYIGKIDDAVRYGQRGIELRDAEANSVPKTMTLTKPSGPPCGHNVISLSLWGTAPFYAYGAMTNLVPSRAVYPGWTCRFYVSTMRCAPLRRLSQRQPRRRAPH